VSETVTGSGDAAKPALRIVRGNPSPEELAALAAVVAAAAGSGDTARPAPVRGRWNDPAHSLRRPLHPGAGGWVAAARLP
jgi:acyl-CoA carboxylase epsilon subunit